jgi:hypothetical protein
VLLQLIQRFFLSFLSDISADVFGKKHRLNLKLAGALAEINAVNDRRLQNLDNLASYKRNLPQHGRQILTAFHD